MAILFSLFTFLLNSETLKFLVIIFKDSFSLKEISFIRKFFKFLSNFFFLLTEIFDESIQKLSIIK